MSVPRVTLSTKLRQQIEARPGNVMCADCPESAPDWASVPYGSLICMECSGRHRSLGTHLSFVRSLHMDSWSEAEVSLALTRLQNLTPDPAAYPTQTLFMLAGGNGPLREYMTDEGFNMGKRGNRAEIPQK
jgi:hypothetical protein